MASQTPPAADRSPQPTRAPGRGKDAPLIRSRIGGIVALVGVALALLSLYLPWLTTEVGEGINAIELTETLDLRAMAPVNFLGLLVLTFLAAVTLATRLKVFAWANAIVAGLVLAAHLTFLYVLIASADQADPLLSGLPAGSSVTYGPIVSAVAFGVVIAGSIWAVKLAEYFLPDRPEGRLLQES